MLKFETILRAIFASLRFHHADVAPLQQVASIDPGELLRVADLCQLTLPLAVRCRLALPHAVRARLERNLAGNALRHDRLLQIHAEIISALRSRRIEFCILKGISHSPCYVDDLKFRPQYDIDFYCPPEHIDRAFQAIRELNFEPVRTRNTTRDHLPPMVRPTEWQWSGDYYDPGIPASVEIHHRLWSPEVEAIEIDDLKLFWDHRCEVKLGPLSFPALHPADRLGYCTLHLLRHLFRGDLKLHNVYELAHFLDRSSSDHEFWSQWQANTSHSFRRLQAIAFTFTCEWFGCVPHPAVDEARDALSPPVRRWFELFALSPALTLAQPNKHELLLHLCLIHDRRKQRATVLRRLLPATMTRTALDAHVNSTTPRLRVQLAISSLRFVIARVWHHARVLPGLLRAAFRLRRAQLRADVSSEPLHRKPPLPLQPRPHGNAFHLARPLGQEQDRGSQRLGVQDPGQPSRATMLD
jgi:hypothetical protein